MVPTALERSRRLVLPEVIGRGRRAHPERAALIFGEDERTHAALHERAQRLATVLAQAGVRRGNRVALLLHNGLEFPESLLACHVLGAVAVPVNFRLAADEIAYVLRDAGARVLIAGEGSPSLHVDGLVLKTGQGYEEAIASAEPHAQPAWLREEDAGAHVLHVRDHRAAEGRDPDARQSRRQHAELDPRDARRRGRCAGSRGSRCSISVASTACCHSSTSGRRAS